MSMRERASPIYTRKYNFGRAARKEIHGKTRKKAWIFLDSFSRFSTFQKVTEEKRKKLPRA